MQAAVTASQVYAFGGSAMFFSPCKENLDGGQYSSLSQAYPSLVPVNKTSAGTV